MRSLLPAARRGYGDAMLGEGRHARPARARRGWEGAGCPWVGGLRPGPCLRTKAAPGGAVPESQKGRQPGQLGSSAGGERPSHLSTDGGACSTDIYLFWMEFSSKA